MGARLDHERACAERLKRRVRTGVFSSGNRPSVEATLSFEAFVSE
jgi:hypothetical protein